jgi:hypothetical protein
MADDFTNKWAAVPQHEGNGWDKPKLADNGHEPWCVIDLTEDDPPIATCDYQPQAVKVAEALNLAEFHYWLFAESTEEDKEE